MSNRERAMQLLEAVPDYKIEYVIAYLQGVTAGDEILEKIPNEETVEAMQELENGGGTVFEGSAHDFISAMLES
ncbi:hypothetical protein D3Z53_12040 [Lachnospiraceae bacterium]|jgi:hypothetical protein|nr:hypothetical protein [uncultured Schaedlerella sp.]EOS38713.1 hypothetical protein C808_02924 [Lachnospiraceae bacterium M18-1]NBI58771.1 hypothetical protein [Lachnospiraceae bacterium]